LESNNLFPVEIGEDGFDFNVKIRLRKKRDDTLSREKKFEIQLYLD
jgi:hypothetical protein